MLVKIEQGTNEWHRLRKQKIGASDAPIIMGVSPWKTPLELWEQKVYGAKTEENFAMRRGKDMEADALEAYNLHTNNFSSPQVYVADDLPWMMASLDGISLDEKTIVEIKCPGSKDHNLAKEGKIPDKYFPQVQHQMRVVDVEICHYFSYVSDDDFALVVVERDDNYIGKLVAKEKEFWDRLQNFDPPETEKQIVQREDEEFLRLANEWLGVQSKLEKLESYEKELRNDLIDLAKGESCSGGGLSLLQIEKKGTVDYKSIPQLQGVDLETYRKPPTFSWRFTKKG